VIEAGVDEKKVLPLPPLQQAADRKPNPDQLEADDGDAKNEEDDDDDDRADGGGP
jgi:hypothetical protein